MEYDLVWFVRNKIGCRLFLLVAVFIAVKFLNLQIGTGRGEMIRVILTAYLEFGVS